MTDTEALTHLRRLRTLLPSMQEMTFRPTDPHDAIRYAGEIVVLEKIQRVMWAHLCEAITHAILRIEEAQ